MANPLSVNSSSTSSASTTLKPGANTALDETQAGAVKTGEAAADQLSPAAKARLQLNASIIQASLNVSIGSQDNPLGLVFKSALTNINEALKADYGDNAIENAASQDNTPEGTASRIVSLTTAFYDAFKRQHAGEDEQAVLDKFMDTIGGGFEKGFKEAQGILDGLGVLNGDIASNIDRTFDLVKQGYADFAAAKRESFSQAASEPAAG